MLKDWTKFEILFFLLGSISAIVLTIVFDGTIINLVFTLTYFWTALLMAKGKYACYILGIISVLFYAYVAYNNSYYGEIISDLGCTLPLMIIGLVNWLKHKDNTNTVIVKEITKKELIIVLLSQVIMFIGCYYLLKAFNTNNLLVSTCSMIASIVATYLTARRSEYGFIGYIINDIILMILWGIPVIEGDLTIIPILLCPVLLFINDSYGVYNWKRIKNKQKTLAI